VDRGRRWKKRWVTVEAPLRSEAPVWEVAERGAHGPRQHARARTEFSTNVTISVTRVTTRGGIAGPRPTSRPAPPLVGRRCGRRRGGEKNHPPQWEGFFFFP